LGEEKIANCKGLATPILKYRGNLKFKALGFMFLSRLESVYVKILIENNLNDKKYLSILCRNDGICIVNHERGCSDRKYERFKDYTGRIKL